MISFKNKFLHCSLKIISVNMGLTNNSICPDWWLSFVSILMLLFFSFLWIQVFLPMCLTKWKDILSEQCNFSHTCPTSLVFVTFHWWPFSLKFRGFGSRWDPVRGIVSSVLSINTSWSLFDLNKRISREFTGLGQPHGHRQGIKWTGSL